MTIKECLKALEGKHIGNRMRAINALNKIGNKEAENILLFISNNKNEKPYIRHYAKRAVQTASPVSSHQKLNGDIIMPHGGLFYKRLLFTGGFLILVLLSFLYIDYGAISEVSGRQWSDNLIWNNKTTENLKAEISEPNPYKLFEMAEGAYNVDAAMIESLWFQESSMGRNLGDYRILDVYKIKKIDSPEVKEWKKKEREAFIAICKANGLDIRKQFGGRYGEMGPFQFLPSTWLVYGKDGNSDGRANPWDMADAVTTVASYLKLYGYKKEDFNRIKRAIAFYNQSPKYFDSLQRNAGLFGMEIK
ncbi:MAG: lytic murein transglycosylase [Nitrospirae bacterium]|nr:lytic murein transglycosylase [Nitrospirota bacterium]